MNTIETTNTYSKDSFKYELYPSLCDRNETHGFNFMYQPDQQQRHHDAHFQNTYNGPWKDRTHTPSLFDTKVDKSQKTLIAPLDVRPNLYNDQVHPWTPTVDPPNLYRSWKPYTTTATPTMTGEYVQFIPHQQPCPVAPINDSSYWVANMNSKLYERRLLSAADEQPYANWYRRQAWAQMLAQNMPSNDKYTVKLDRPENTYCAAQARNGGQPPCYLHT